MKVVPLEDDSVAEILFFHLFCFLGLFFNLRSAGAVAAVVAQVLSPSTGGNSARTRGSYFQWPKRRLAAALASPTPAALRERLDRRGYLKTGGAGGACSMRLVGETGS